MQVSPLIPPSKKCETCGMIFYNKNRDSIARFIKRARFCSKSCLGKWNAKHQGKKGAFKKGIIPWIKGRKMPSSFSWNRIDDPEEKELRRKESQKRAMEHYKIKKENRLKISARSYLNNQIRDGFIKRLFCEICNDSKSEAHHYKGYAQKNWLNVEWLCKKCHSKVHRLTN